MPNILDFNVETILSCNTLSGSLRHDHFILRFVADEFKKTWKSKFTYKFNEIAVPIYWNMKGMGPSCYFLKKIEGKNLFEGISSLSIYHKLQFAILLMDVILPQWFSPEIGPKNIFVCFVVIVVTHYQDIASE